MDENLVRSYPDFEEHHFWWKVRRDLVLSLVERRAPLEQVSILDVGCGSGRTLEFLTRHGAGKVMGIEIDPSFRKSIVGDLSRIEFGDFLELEFGEQFDVILMLDVVEHIKSDDVVVDRAKQLLTDTGTLIVSVPAYQWLWTRHDDSNAHYRRYTASELGSLLKGCGLAVEQLGYMFAGLVIPKLLVRIAEKVGFRASNAVVTMRRETLLSRLSYRWFSAEASIALRRSRMLPFGTSVMAVARRAET